MPKELNHPQRILPDIDPEIEAKISHQAGINAIWFNKFPEVQQAWKSDLGIPRRRILSSEYTIPDLTSSSHRVLTYTLRAGLIGIFTASTGATAYLTFNFLHDLSNR